MTRKNAEQHSGEGAVYRQVFQFSVLYHFLYAVCACASLISMPLFGGALYLLGRITVLFSDRFRPPRSEELSRTEKITGSAVLAFLLALLLYILMIHYPQGQPRSAVWTVLYLSLALPLRSGMTVRLQEKQLLAGQGKGGYFTMALVLQVLLFLPFLALLFLFCPGWEAVSLAVGYLVGNVWEFYEIWRDRERLRTWNRTDRAELDAIRSVHSYRIFQDFSVAVAFAVQVTVTVTVAYLGASSQELFYRLLTAFGTTALCAEAVDLMMGRRPREDRDPMTAMMIGLGLWLYGLVLFYRNMGRPGGPEAYLSVALCTAGATVCIRLIVYLEEKMRSAAAFALGREKVSAYDWLFRSRIELSVLSGQTCSVVLLGALWIFGGPGSSGVGPEQLIKLRPLMLIPAVLPVLTALVLALRFPITARHLQKLDRYLNLVRNGEQNEALRRQLENVIVRKSLRRYGIRILILILRPLYRHRIKGRENVAPAGETPCVFVCNHGEIYGPVVTTLFMPFPFRPWVTSEMTDREVISEYIYRNTFSKVSWLPDGAAKFFCVRIAGPALAWIMRSVEPIPVYHGNPRQLMETFRATIDAMETGDNILVFPENSTTSADGKFLKDGVGEFFSGFAVIGQLYYKRTGKRCRFVPVYADKYRKVLSIGGELYYDGEKSPSDEKERLCTVLREEMLRMHDEIRAGKKA